jgi:hypothetical protein
MLAGGQGETTSEPTSGWASPIVGIEPYYTPSTSFF